jgi:hypothetical protein
MQYMGTLTVALLKLSVQPSLVSCFKIRSRYGEVTRMWMKEILLAPLGDFIVIELRTFAVG